MTAENHPIATLQNAGDGAPRPTRAQFQPATIDHEEYPTIEPELSDGEAAVDETAQPE